MKGKRNSSTPQLNLMEAYQSALKFLASFFRLYTPHNGVNPEILSRDDPHGLERSSFDPQLPVKFIVHGFLQHGQVKWVRDMTAEFMKKVNMSRVTAKLIMRMCEQ